MRSCLRRRARRAALAVALLVTVAASVAAPAAAADRVKRFPTATESASLQRALARFLERRMGRATVGVTDLDTGQRVLLRPRHPQLTASVVKVEIVEALLARHHAPLHPPRIRQVRRVIERSSNTDAQALWNASGRPED